MGVIASRSVALKSKTAAPNVVGTKGAEILIAGCDTGQHSIETGRQFPGSRVLGIDLSLNSLCYAKRKTHELGLKNVEYAQADILKLQSIDRSFDVIEAGGVLHHGQSRRPRLLYSPSLMSTLAQFVYDLVEMID